MQRLQRLAEKVAQNPTQVLKDIEAEIIESLNISNTDHDRCMRAMQTLDALNITQPMLAGYPPLLKNLKKVKNYKNDEKIRLKADYLMNKFKSLFMNGLDEVWR